MRHVHEARSVKDLMADPIGRYFAGRSFLAWVQTPKRLGVTHVGPLDPADYPAISDLFGLHLSPTLTPRFDILFEVTPGVLLDRGSFHVIEQFLSAAIDSIVPRTERFAAIKPSGLAGAAFSGVFHDWLVPRFEQRARLFGDRDQALEWLEVGADSDARIELDAVIEAFTHTTPLLRRTRDVLAGDLHESLAGVAAKLGTSARTLQRQLKAQGTTFRDELTRARVRVAETLLLETDDKIEAIALELGFTSVASFTAMFRTAVGETPAAYRTHR